MNTMEKKEENTFNEVPSELLQLLMELALLGTNYNMFKTVAVIYKGIMAVRPNHPSVVTGMAISLFAAGNTKGATNLLESMLKNDSQKYNDLAKAFLAMIYRFSESDKWAKLCDEIIENNQDKEAVEMAQALKIAEIPDKTK